MVSKIRSLMSLCLVRIELTLFACEAAPQPEIPEHSIRQSFSVFALASTCWPFVWATADAASANTASAALAVNRFMLFLERIGLRCAALEMIGESAVGGKPL